MLKGLAGQGHTSASASSVSLSLYMLFLMANSSGHARTYCSYRSRYRHTAVHIVCISILHVSLVYRQSCVHITPYTKIRHHIAIISILHIYNMVRGHMPTYHGLSNIQTNRVVFFRLPIYSFLHRYATALSDISQTATICNKYHLRYAYRNFSI